jgi:hypothetical protein
MPEDFTAWKDRKLNPAELAKACERRQKKQSRKEIQLQEKLAYEHLLPKFYEDLKSIKAYRLAMDIYTDVFLHTRYCDSDIKRTLVDRIRNYAIELAEQVHVYFAITNRNLNISQLLEMLQLNLRMLLKMRQISIGCWESISSKLLYLSKAVSVPVDALAYEGEGR